MTTQERAFADLAAFAAQLQGDEKSEAQAVLDAAVRAAYGMSKDENPLAFLLRLNLELAEQEAEGAKLTPPGLPPVVQNPAQFTTADCIQAA